MSICSFAQKDAKSLEFKTNFYDALDKWVVVPKAEKDSLYLYGFVYLDDMAGFTFNVESTFYIDKSGKYIGIPADKVSMIKHRLEKKTVLMAVLQSNKLKELGVQNVPDWLKYYNNYNSEVQKLTRIGYHLNALDACETALTYLLKADKIDPFYKGLTFEIAYAYNHLGQFDKSLIFLQKALEKDSKNDLLYKELGFSYMNLKKFKEAETTYKKGIEISKDDNIKSEMAVNMANVFFIEKNKLKFDEWATITRKYAKQNSPYLKYLDQFEKNWEMKR